MDSAFGEHLHTLRRLWRHPRVAREDLIAFQSRKLRHVIAHAYANVAYWRGLFDRAGLKPQDIRGVEDLGAIPITSRRDLMTTPLEDLVARSVNPQRLVLHVTSGSSGRPFSTRRAAFEEHLMNMFRIRARQQYGVRVRDRTAGVAFGPVGNERPGVLGHLRQGLGVYRKYLVRCVQSREEILGELDRLRPDVIGGYSGTLAHIAPVAAEGRYAGIRPRLITTGGETLIPAMRRRIEQSFRARVFDTYGAHEFNVLAWECPQTGLYHVCEDNAIVEVLRDGRPAAQGERGVLVATALHAYAMPFLRYRVDDVVTRGPTPCPCGQPFSTLQAVEGRMVDYFALPGGRRHHPYDAIIKVVLPEMSWIGQYQMRQEKEDRIVFRVAPLRPPKPEELERAKQAGRLCFGPEVDFRVEIVDQIPFEPGGKFRVSHSMVNSAYEGAEFGDR